MVTVELRFANMGKKRGETVELPVAEARAWCQRGLACEVEGHPIPPAPVQKQARRKAPSAKPAPPSIAVLEPLSLVLPTAVRALQDAERNPPEMPSTLNGIHVLRPINPVD